jgi:hypothetical protein
MTAVDGVPSGQRHLSSLDLDALALGALSAAEAAAAQVHLERCPRCRHEHETTRALHQRFRQVVLPATRERLRPRPWWRKQPWLLAMAPAVMAAATLLLLVHARPAPLVVDEPALATKGAASLRLFARRGDRVFAVHDRDPLRTGDAVRFAIEPAGWRYLLIGSVDGAGKATLYFPFDGAASAAIAPDRPYELPGSIVLDDAPGPERVFALLTAAPLDGSAVKAALAALGHRGADAIRGQRRLPVAATQLSLVFEKQP